MEALYPGMTPLQCFAKTQAQLFVARHKIGALDTTMNELKAKEAELDTTIFEIIKKAYRVLSLKVHPDRLANPTDEDTARFQELKEAYAVLSDSALRRKYLQSTDHEEFIRNFKPKTDNETHYESKADQQRASRAQQRATASAAASAPDGTAAAAPVFRLTGGVPHRCSRPEVVWQRVVNNNRGDSKVRIRWTCTDAENLAIKHYNVTMIVHPLGAGKSTTHNMGSVSAPEYESQALMPGLYDFTVVAVNEHAAGDPSLALRIHVADLEAERLEREREQEERAEARRKALLDEWERGLSSLENEQVARGRLSMTRITELLKQLAELVSSMRKDDAPTELFDRSNALHQKLSASRFIKMELATWRAVLQKNVKELTTGQGRPDNAGSEMATEAYYEWPSSEDLIPAVRNLIFQTVCNLAETAPTLQIVVDPEVQALYSASEIGLLGNDDFEAAPEADPGVPDPEQIYAPKWRAIQPYDRIIEVLRMCSKRPDLFGPWMGKISSLHSKLVTERKRRESEWKNKVARNKRAADNADRMAAIAATEAARKGMETPQSSVEGSDRYDVGVSDFAQQQRFTPVRVVAEVPVVPEEEEEVVDFAELDDFVDAQEQTPQPAAEAPAPAPAPVPEPEPFMVREKPKQPQAPIAPPAKKPTGLITPTEIEQKVSQAPQTLAALNKESTAFRTAESTDAANGNRGKQKYQNGNGKEATTKPVGVWKASKKCHRALEDGSCSYGVRCWHAKEHTWAPAVQQPTPPASKVNSPQTTQYLNGLRITIEKNAPAAGGTASAPEAAVAAPAPAPAPAPLVAVPTESASAPVAVAPKIVEPPVASISAPATGTPRKPSPAVDTNQLAAIWEMPTPSLQNRQLGSPTRATNDLAAKAARSPPGLSRKLGPQQQPVQQQQQQLMSKEPSRLSPITPPSQVVVTAVPVTPLSAMSLPDFLNSLGLGRFAAVFEENEFDMEALLLASDDDFKALKVPLGPLVKLKEGIKKYREATPEVPTPVQQQQQQQFDYPVASQQVEYADQAEYEDEDLVHATFEQAQLYSQDFNGTSKPQVQIPEHFLCPITQEVGFRGAERCLPIYSHRFSPSPQIMTQPVVAPDGFTYEEDSIRDWLKKHGTSPMTQVSLVRDSQGNKTKIILTPNFTLKSLIAEFKQKFPREYYEWL